LRAGVFHEAEPSMVESVLAFDQRPERGRCVRMSCFRRMLFAPVSTLAPSR
jgi:hypothetical protein